MVLTEWVKVDRRSEEEVSYKREMHPGKAYVGYPFGVVLRIYSEYAGRHWLKTDTRVEEWKNRSTGGTIQL